MIIHKLLLKRDKFMPELHLQQPGFTFSSCRLFTKHKERIKKNIEKTGNVKYLYRNELDKACLAHDAVYSVRKDLTNRTIFIFQIRF